MSSANEKWNKRRILPDVVIFLLSEADAWPDKYEVKEAVLFDPVGNRELPRDATDAVEVTEALVAESPIMP